MDSSTEKEKEGNLMKTHFLKPYVTSIDGAVAELPLHRFCVPSSDLKESFSRISFNGFWFAHRNFKSLAKKMEALHEPTWRKAGIFEAIKASTYRIPKNQSLIQALVEKWCPETKSFVFPWGEATVTLEDVMVLLGFSVLGSPVFAPLESSEMGDSVERLEKARVENRGHDYQVRQGLWISSFLGRGDQMEHEAFLAMWLSQFVFPDMSRRSISRNVLPIAVRLARGERIALAPAVLARLYRDLGQIQAFAREKSTQNVTLKSLFKLVQVWTWERFKNTSPKAREIPKGEPRIARWDYLPQTSEIVRFNLDDFDWRPYTKPLRNWKPPRFYPEEAMWMTVDDNHDDEFVSFARCMRVSQLVGIGIVEDYYPNRVAMQFGLAQDLPGLITDQRSFTEKEAWDDYNKSVVGLKLYMPSCLVTTSVTERYQDWWLKSISKFLNPSESTETLNASNTIHDDDDDDDDVLPLGQMLQKVGESFLRKLRRFKTRRFEIKTGNIGDGGASASTELPLGQLFKKELMKRTSEHLSNNGHKRAREDDESSMDHKDDDSTIAQMIKPRRNDKSGSKAKKSMVQRPSNENNSSNPLIDSNGGIIDIVVSPPETRKTCDDEPYVNESNADNNDGNKQPKYMKIAEHLTNKRRKYMKQARDKRLKYMKQARENGSKMNRTSKDEMKIAEDSNKRRNYMKQARDKRLKYMKQARKNGSKVNRRSKDGIKIAEDLNKRRKYMKRARENDDSTSGCCQTQVLVHSDNDGSLSIAQELILNKKYSDVKNSGRDFSKLLDKKSTLEAGNNDSVPIQKVSSIRDDRDATLPPPEKDQRNEETDEIGSKAGKNMVESPFDENNSSKPPFDDIVVSPPETRQTCDDELDVYGSNAEKKTMVDDGSKKPDCLLHEDGIIAGEKASSDEKLCSSEAVKEDDVFANDDSLTQKKLSLEELALEADNNEPSPHQKLASGETNGDETSRAYKSKVLSPSDESNIHIAVGEGSQGHDCLLHDTALASEETMKFSEQIDASEKRNNDFGVGDVDDDYNEKRFEELKVLASSMEERILKAERTVAWLIERRAIKQRKLAAARWV